MSLMTAEKLQSIIEAALMVAGQPLTIAALQNLFNEDERPANSDIKTALAGIQERHKDSGIELHEVASGWRLQARTELSPWLSRLWEERAPRYSRAFLETLAIIAYKQPITRAEIEEIRGVTVSTNIIKTLSEREWVRLVGFRDTPGKPALYGTTKTFLDHFNLSSLTELPTLAEFKDLQAQEADLQVQLAIENSNVGPDNSEVIPEEREAIIAEDAAELVETAEAVEAEFAAEAVDVTEAAEAVEAIEAVEAVEAAETIESIETVEAIEAEFTDETVENSSKEQPLEIIEVTEITTESTQDELLESAEDEEVDAELAVAQS